MTIALPDSVQRIALITGATSGLGYAIALALARLGLRVIVVGRDQARTQTAVHALGAASGNPHVEGLHADLSRQADVRQLAATYLQHYDRLDLLVNNAGAGYAAYTESPDGIEMTWALNHLAGFLLTHLLRDGLRRSADGRVLSITSSSHRGAQIHFDAPNLRDSYSANRAYGQSKLANIMFTQALARRLGATPVSAYAIDPGPVKTHLFTRETMTATRNLVLRMGMRIHGLIARPPEEAAHTIVHVATAPEVRHQSGTHWAKLRIVAPAAAATNQADQERLWTLSERMTGIV